MKRNDSSCLLVITLFGILFLVSSQTASALPSLNPPPPSRTPRVVPPTPTPDPDAAYQSCLSHLLGVFSCVDEAMDNRRDLNACLDCQRFCDSLPPTLPIIPHNTEPGDPTVQPCSRSICYGITETECGLPPRPTAIPLDPEAVPYTG